MRHGPHHDAQKSTRTMPSWVTTCSKSCSVRVVVAMLRSLLDEPVVPPVEGSGVGRLFLVAGGGVPGQNLHAVAERVARVEAAVARERVLVAAVDLKAGVEQRLRDV